MYLFIQWWLCWVFVAVRLFSGYGDLFSVRSRALLQLWCAGVSLQRLLLPWSTALGCEGFSVWARRSQELSFPGSGAIVVSHGLRCSAALEPPWIRQRTPVCCIDRQILSHWATRETPQCLQKAHSFSSCVPCWARAGGPQVLHRSVLTWPQAPSWALKSIPVFVSRSLSPRLFPAKK